MKNNFTILIIVFINSFCFANNETNVFQNKIDSLKSEISLLNSNTIEKGKLYSQLANIYSKQENFTDAKSNNLKALEIFKSLKAHANSTKVLLDLAMNYDKSNQFDIAIEYSYKALDELDLIKNELKKEDFDFRKGMIIMNMGVIYGQINNNSESLKLLINANKLLEKSNPFYKAVCQENLGNAYSELKEYDKAIINFNNALNFYINNKVEPKLISNTLNNIGNIHIANKDYHKALEVFQKALTYIDGNEIYLSEKTGVLNNIGDVYIELDSLKKAKYYLDKSIDLSEGEAGKRFIKDNYKSRVKLFSKQQDFENAFINLKILNSIEDSLYEPKLLEKIASIKSEYDLKVEQRENLLKIQLLNREKQLNSYKYYTLIGVVIVIILIAIFIYNRQKQKAKLKSIEFKNIELEKIQLADKLKYKNNQLTNYAIYIIKKNEFLDDIKSEIDKLKSENDSKINSLSKIVNQHIIASQDRKDFEIRVKNENQDFYYKLDTKFPELSDKNKNLCSLLLLDLTSKEIASLLNISVESVDKSRYRLRKKLNIPKEISISAFLKKL